MKYSYRWLQTHIAEPLPEAKTLAEVITFHAFEVEAVESFGTDTLLEINILPDRAGDCLSHYGLAREIAGLLQLTLKTPERILAPIAAKVPVTIQSDLCKRYLIVRIDGVTVGAAPAWLHERLESIGQRSINAVVDATNFVLNDVGQPTHAFDANKIVGSITVRQAKPDETITTLSHEEKVLQETDLVIADDAGVLAIAGVKGGIRAEVTADTKNIILEIANFDAVAVRKTSRRLNLITDASKRFENNLSAVGVKDTGTQLIALVTDIAGGHVTAVTDYYHTPEVARQVRLSVADITRVLGASVTGEKIAAVFDQYHYTYTYADNIFTLNVPYYRADIIGAHDIAEEVGRVIGYDAIAAVPLPFTPLWEENTVDRSIQAVKKYLIDKGFSEVMTYSFCKKGEVTVAYGPKDKSALRTTLLDGVKESFELNKRNAPLLGQSEVKLFEVGTVFFAQHEEVYVATAQNGEVKEWPLKQFILEHGVTTQPTLVTAFPATPTPFHVWSNYPYIVRDVSVWLPAGDTETQHALAAAIKTFADVHSAVPAVLFDSFTKDGQTSFAYRLVFQAADRTLTDAEAATLLAPLLTTLAAIPGAVLR